MGIPRNFTQTKNQVEKDTIRYFLNKDKNDPEVQAEFYMMLKELQAFVETKVANVEERMMETLEEEPIFLPEHRKKVFYDSEAKWIFVEDMTPSDSKKAFNRKGTKRLHD